MTSIGETLMKEFKGDVLWTKTNKKAAHYGEVATEVTVCLSDGRTVEGTFTTQNKGSFGGVDFSGNKDIEALMIAKVRAVLSGKAEL